MNEVIAHRVKDLVDRIDSCQVMGDVGGTIENVATIWDASPGCLTWIKPGLPDGEDLLAATTATCVVTAIRDVAPARADQTFLVCDNPKLVFVKLLKLIVVSAQDDGVHPTALVSPNAVLHPSVVVGAYCVIDECKIGEGTVVDSYVRIHRGTVIGSNVRISTGAVIGGDGYGFVKDENGLQVRFPHLGFVEIEDDVEIGANTCIDRGTLGRTLVRRGAKVDNLVHIAHNVTIGRGTMVIAHAMIGGSTRVGDGAWIAPGSSVRDAVAIGDAAVVGLGAVVTRSVPGGETWAGNPAKKLTKD